MTKRTILTSYLNHKHEVIRKTRSTNPNAAAEKMSGYLANQYFRNSQKPREFAVFAEVYDEETGEQHADAKYQPGSGKVTTTFHRNPTGFETRYAVTPLIEEINKVTKKK